MAYPPFPVAIANVPLTRINLKLLAHQHPTRKGLLSGELARVAGKLGFENVKYKGRYAC
ncbi:hypothetical protein [uncultured Nostoc sp.]|uniref:hypothetical protein n=1 Tax=uncultured Nostoc sp. TaxID=340711 RepID=UPI0035C9BE1B